MLSDDGQTWEALAPITGADLAKLLRIGARLQAFTRAGEVLESADGGSWRARPELHAPSANIAYGNGVYVATEGFSVLRSRDLAAWEPVAMPPCGGPGRVIWTGTRFVIGGFEGISVSTDGSSWRFAYGSPTFRYDIWHLLGNASTIVAITEIGYGSVSTDGGASWRGLEVGFIAPVAWTGSRFVGPDAASWDGVSWERADAGVLPYLSSLAGTEAHAVAVGDAIMWTSCAGGGEPLYLPAATHTTGYNATIWRTDLYAANLGDTFARFTLELLPRNTESLAPAAATFQLAPGVMATYTDVAGSVFAFAGGATLRVRPLEGEVTAAQRVYSVAGSTTLGQHVPALPERAALGTGMLGRLIGLSHSTSLAAGKRTNIGIVSASEHAMVASVDLFLADGTLLGRRSYALRPYESIQRNLIFNEVTPHEVTGGYAVVSTETAGARFFAYAFLVDNATGAPEMVLAQ